MQIVYKPCPVCKGKIIPLVPQPENKEIFYCMECETEFIVLKKSSLYFYSIEIE